MRWRCTFGFSLNASQEEADDEAGEDDDEDAEVCKLESGEDATALGFSGDKSASNKHFKLRNSVVKSRWQMECCGVHDAT